MTKRPTQKERTVSKWQHPKHKPRLNEQDTMLLAKSPDVLNLSEQVGNRVLQRIIIYANRKSKHTIQRDTEEQQSDGPSQFEIINLIAEAKTNAVENNNDQAFRLFVQAFHSIQVQLQRYSQSRNQQLQSLRVRGEVGAGTANLTRVVGSYPTLTEWFKLMREILGYYPRLTREALRNGNQELAHRYSNLGFVLRQELEASILENATAITMELTESTREGTPSYILHGAQGREESVTPMAGRPGLRADEPTVYAPSMEELSENITNQEEFITSLYRHPQIRTEFDNQNINMNKLTDRLRVWRVMYQVFQSNDIGLGPLGSLLDLMEQYLKGFTRHTEFNIRDFGVNYLSTEFPEDLDGRAIRDCGVYALTTAYEVYLTARNANLPVNFQLYTMPEHVTLVIFDQNQGTHYVVNNDQIDGPYRGDPLEAVARAYGRTLGRRHLIAPAVGIELGSTNIRNARRFRTRAWHRYRASISWGLQPEGRRSPTDTRDESERREATYHRYYQAARQFDRGAMVLGQKMDNLNRQLSDVQDQKTIIEAFLSHTLRIGNELTQIFEEFGIHANIRVHRSHLAMIRRNAIYLLFTEGSDRHNHPLARLANVISYYQYLGGQQLSAEQQIMITNIMHLVNRVPLLKESLRNYAISRRPLSF